MSENESCSVNGTTGPQCKWKLKKRGRPDVSATAATNPSLVEVHEWVQPSHCHQHDNTLRPGHLLRWMDITACLSAEKHAKFPCVTVSVDDITFDTTVSVGHVVILNAVVNRAFSSSLEVGISVQSEDPLTGKRQQVCNAYCVFVAKPKDGSKIKLSPVPLMTEREHREHLLAAERRRMRITYTKDIDRLLRSLQVAEEDPSPKDNFSSPPPVATITVSQTKLQTVHIVLPVHANHHGTTFGGQIMEWMTDLATISALRLCRCKLILEGIESVHFKGPSYVGERVFVQTSVNRVFSNNRFEVGIRVEGYAVGEEERHINSAFYIFRVTEENVVLPKLIADTEIEARRAASAVARHCLWLDRKSIQIQEHLVALNSENIYNLILKNTSKLMTNFSLRNWEALPSSSEVEFSKKTVNENMFLKLVLSVEGVDAMETYRKLGDYRARTKWDFLSKNVRVVKCITEEDNLLHLAYNSMRQEELPKDFVLLASKRTPLANQANDDQQFYMVAYSSVLFTDLPPLTDYTRSQVISSGYIVEDLPPSSEHSKCCRITYIHQLGSTVMPFFSKDLLGVSSLMEKLCLSMKKYILTT